MTSRIGNKPPPRTTKTEKPKAPAKKDKTEKSKPTPKKPDAGWLPWEMWLIQPSTAFLLPLEMLRLTEFMPPARPRIGQG